MVYSLLCVVIFALCVKIYLMKKSAKEISSAFADRLQTDTNTLIAISSHDKDMRELADSINKQLKILRKEHHRYTQGDTELKEAVIGISHDLRTPLTAICGYLDLLEREEKSETVRQYLGQISNRTDVMKQLTEELFRYSVVAYVKENSIERICLNNALEESIASFYGAICQKQIVPQISITETRVERYLDRSALARIFGNIISNALKYSDGDFSVSLDSDGAITFSNTAESLNYVEAGKLFDRFYTVETARNSTGLGLSIAKLLTEQLGGKIKAEYLAGKLVITLLFK